MTMTPDEEGIRGILAQIRYERGYQISRWGVDADLRVNTPMDFVGYIAYHSTRWFGGGFRPYERKTLIEFRRQMVKVAALAVAAIEHVDSILDGSNSRPDVLQENDDV